MQTPTKHGAIVHGRRATDEEKGAKRQNLTAGLMVSQQIWSTTVERVTIDTRTTSMLQHLTTAWADHITPVDPSETLADLDPQTEADERQCLV